MFELFENLIRKQDYFGAGTILSLLGSMLAPPKDPKPPGFYNSQVRVIPGEGCLHVFVVCDDRKTFDDLPGSEPSYTDNDSVRLYSKVLDLAPVTHRVRDVITIHIIYTSDIEVVPLQGFEEFEQEEMSSWSH